VLEVSSFVLPCEELQFRASGQIKHMPMDPTDWTTVRAVMNLDGAVPVPPRLLSTYYL